MRERVGSTAVRLGIVVGALALIVALSARPALAHETYTVQPGDTLSEIAAREGLTVSAIMDANGLENPDRIRIGQKLSIPHGDSTGSDKPAAATTPDAIATGEYTIQPGDSLSGIARDLGVTRAELIELNDITDPDRIVAGKTLVVPATGARLARSYPNLPREVLATPERLDMIVWFEHWAEANRLPVDLVMAVAWQESAWRANALSSSGAVGVGQIMPATGAWIASDLIGQPDLDPTVADQNIRMSARYLRWLIDYLGTEELALAGYFQGPGAVKAGIQLESTEQYVASVLAHRRLFERQ